MYKLIKKITKKTVDNQQSQAEEVVYIPPLYITSLFSVAIKFK